MDQAELSAPGGMALWVERTTCTNAFLSISCCFWKGLSGVLVRGAGGPCDCTGRQRGVLRALLKRGASRGAWGLLCLRPGSGKWNWVRARPLVAIWGTATGEEESRAWEHEDGTSAGLQSVGLYVARAGLCPYHTVDAPSAETAYSPSCLLQDYRSSAQQH